MVTIRGLMKALSIRNLQKTYANGNQALKGIDFSVEIGDFYALLGPNGAGKTTAIGIITSLVNKSSGEVEIFGHSLDKEIEAAKACIGLVPQEINLNLWERVDNFLGSVAASRHYTVELGANDRATFRTGDGVKGSIPALGVGNVRSTYRVGAENDGNIGANSITIDKTGLSFVSRLWNPRQANGWAKADGADEASLEQAKIEGPASLRVGEVALGPSDAVRLTIDFVDEDGSKPYSRARAFEEGFGPKTIELAVVTRGGGQASAEQLARLESYFNGDALSYPPKKKHLVANQEVVGVNFANKVIDIVATVYGSVTKAAIENRLAAIVHPEALKDDGVTWEWNFGAEVDDSRLSHEIFETDESITKVELTTPAAPVTLLPRELPLLGTVNITVIEPS